MEEQVIEKKNIQEDKLYETAYNVQKNPRDLIISDGTEQIETIKKKV
jgi:hypothetical protein